MGSVSALSVDRLRVYWLVAGVVPLQQLVREGSWRGRSRPPYRGFHRCGAGGAELAVEIAGVGADDCL